MSKLKIFLLILGFLHIASIYALMFDLPSNSDNVLGAIKVIKTTTRKTLLELGREYNLGYYEMVEANPGINPNLELNIRTEVIIPGKFILPERETNKIIINLAELRLYYFLPDNKKVFTCPVGLGREGWNTPLGNFSIVSKIEKPTWRPSAHIIRDGKKQGITIPAFTLPGPDNPLGEYAMRLSKNEYLLHGTNKPEGVGRPSSAGCIRLFPEDIKLLFNLIKLNTPVKIIDNPIKLGMLNNHLYLESHAPLHEKSVSKNYIYKILDTLFSKTAQANILIKWSLVQLEIEKHTGIPIQIS